MNIMKNIYRIILAVFVSMAVISCDKDDDSLGVDLEGLGAPTDLGATFKITQDNTGLVTITPTGVGANMFSIDFGDGNTSEEIRVGESVEHVYAEGEYEVVVTGKNLAGETAQGTQPLTVSFRQPENLEVVISKGTDGYSVTVSASADYAAGFDVYFGETADEEPTALMPGETVTHTYAETGTYDIRVVALSGGAETVEYKETVEMKGPVPAPTPKKLPESVISLFSNAYTNVPVDTWRTEWSQADLEETDIEGNDIKKYSNLSYVGILTESTQVDATSMTHFRTDIFSLDAETFKVKLVDFGPNGVYDGGGDDVEHEVVFDNIPQGEWVTLDIPLEDFTGLTTRAHISQLIYSAAPAGETTVLVDNVFFYDDSVTIPTSPVIAAPTPIHVEGNVKSIFSDKYSDPAGVDYYPDWGQSTTYELVSINGNAAIKYGNANYQGINIGEDIDATVFDYVHIDVWSGDYSSIPFFLISKSGEKSVNLNVTPNQWNSFQIPLSEFTSQGLDISDVFQFKFDVQPSGSGGAFYIDNLYFSSESSATTVTLPVSFENSSLTYSLTPFGGAETVVVANPYQQGINPSNTVVRFTKTEGAEFWAGATLQLDELVDFSSTEKISVKVFSPKAGIPVLLKLENNADANVNMEVKVNTTKENQWEELVFDYSGLDTSQEYGKVIMFFEFIEGVPGDGSTYYYDDIQLVN